MRLFRRCQARIDKLEASLTLFLLEVLHLSSWVHKTSVLRRWLWALVPEFTLFSAVGVLCADPRFLSVWIVRWMD
jgi:hypothetical protein